MSSEQNIAMERRLYTEVWEQGNFAVIDEVVDRNAVDHSGPPGLPPGSEGYKAFAKMYRDAFPDAKIKMDRVIAEGDKVAIHWTATGTHKGELMGIPATGKKINVTGISIDRFSNGKIVETWQVMDQLAMMVQLGVAKAPGG